MLLVYSERSVCVFCAVNIIAKTFFLFLSTMVYSFVLIVHLSVSSFLCASSVYLFTCLFVCLVAGWSMIFLVQFPELLHLENDMDMVREACRCR